MIFILVCLLFLLFYTIEGFFNQLSPVKRNQSYDIRGDPFIIPKKHTLWYNSSIIQTPRIKKLFV
jgi:hypothetical protein